MNGGNVITPLKDTPGEPIAGEFGTIYAPPLQVQD